MMMTPTGSMLCLIAAVSIMSRAAGADGPSVHVFVLAGQSNMVGMGSIDHLDLLVQRSDGSDNEFRETLWNGTAYKGRDDVYIKYDSNHGKLTVGRTTGYAGRNAFGPEVMFGWTVGDGLAGNISKQEKGGGFRRFTRQDSMGRQVVGGRLPTAVCWEGNYSGIKPVQYGWFYRSMIADVLDAINNLPLYVPNYNESAGFELAGLVWFQGWNDMLNWDTVDEYGPNLVKFIRDVRLDLDAPQLPFVIGELGMAGLNPEGRGADRTLTLRASQQSVCSMDEFQSNTRFVRTAPYAVLNGTNYNGIYHYNGRADTYFHIGQAFGVAMLDLMNLARVGKIVHSNVSLSTW